MDKLPRLRGFILPLNLERTTWEVDSDERDKIFEQCPLLEFFDIELEVGSMDPRKFARYNRQGGGVMMYNRPCKQRFFNSRF
jgi:hypothetical protein